MNRPKRPIVAQSFIPYSLRVGVKPTPLNTSWQQAQISGMYTSLIISVPKAAPNPVLLGDAGINIASNNGLEILPGCPCLLSIRNERQLYELQAPLIEVNCQIPEVIPFIVFDPSNIYLVSIAAVNVGVILFTAPFV